MYAHEVLHIVFRASVELTGLLITTFKCIHTHLAPEILLCSAYFCHDVPGKPNVGQQADRGSQHVADTSAYTAKHLIA